MEHDLHLTEEQLEKNTKRKKLFKAEISYKFDDSLEIPDLSSNFEPIVIKKDTRVKVELVNVKKQKNKSKKLL